MARAMGPLHGPALCLAWARFAMFLLVAAVGAPLLAALATLEALAARVFDWRSAERGKRVMWSAVGAMWPDLVVVARPFKKGSYGDCVWAFPEASDRVVLTIDDCPGDSPAKMEELLDLLKEHGARATLFCTTDFIEERGERTQELLQRALSEGHELGNHMPADKPYDSMGEAEFREEIARAERVLAAFDPERFGPEPSKPKWFRPPMGKQSATMARVLREKGYHVAIGDVFSNDPWIGGDMDPPAAWAIRYHTRFTRRYASAGSIVIFHAPNDTFRAQVIPVLGELLPAWKSKGLRCVPLADFTAGAEAEEENGVVQTEVAISEQ